MSVEVRIVLDLLPEEYFDLDSPGGMVQIRRCVFMYTSRDNSLELVSRGSWPWGTYGYKYNLDGKAGKKEASPWSSHSQTKEIPLAIQQRVKDLVKAELDSSLQFFGGF